jgi:hypothetical protein
MSETKAWAIIRPNGTIDVSSHWETEDDAWRIILGWPTRGEVRERKEQGWKAREVTVTWED